VSVNLGVLYRDTGRLSTPTRPSARRRPSTAKHHRRVPQLPHRVPHATL